MGYREHSMKWEALSGGCLLAELDPVKAWSFLFELPYSDAISLW